MRNPFAALAIALLFSAPCLAEDKPAAGAPKDAGQALEFKKQLLEKFDVNKDGVLSKEEQMRIQSVGGMAAGFSAAEEFLKRFDLNRDGKLSDAEKMAGLQALQKMRGQGGAVSGGAIGGVGGFGAAGGGNVPAGGNEPKGKPEKVNPLVKRFDKDGDGKLNAEEKAAAQEELKKGKKPKAKKDKEAEPKSK